MIRIRKLSYTFANGQPGLRRIDLEIPDGQLLVIAGANGSGKTTLLRHLNGLLLPQTGIVLVDGIAVAEDLKGIRRKVGMVFQEPDNQIVGETVFSDVAFGPQNLSWPRDVIAAAVTKALAQVGLEHLSDQSPHLLSGGERKRLTIAGVLVMQPQVVVFDEPFANLDYPGVQGMLAQIVALHQEGRTIVVSAHDIEKIAYFAQRLVIMQQGRIVADGDPGQLYPVLEQFDVRLPCSARMGLPVDSWLS
jgi:biotin transport system ATP-binding protein